MPNGQSCPTKPHLLQWCPKLWTQIRKLCHLSASIVVLSVWSMRQLVDQLDVWPCKDISLARKGRTQITLDHFLSHQKSSSSPCYLSMVSGCEEVDLRAHLRIARAYQQLAILEPSKQLASSDGSIIVSCKISALCHG